MSSGSPDAVSASMRATRPVAFDELYDPDEYLYFLEETLRLEDTQQQCTFIEHVLGINEPSRLLDLGCGHGRHALELARRGHRVLGLDLISGFLERGRQQAEAQGLKVQLEQADICAFEVDTLFDHAICMFDAFGFMADEGQESMLRCTRDALVPGGRLLLDLRTREWMVRLAPAAVLDKGEGNMMIDRHDFDVESGRFIDRRTTLWNGRRRDVEFSVRLYSFTEIGLLLRAAGFSVVRGYGDFEGGPLALDKPRTLVVAEKTS